MRRPNILLLVTDDHGRWAQPCYGNADLQTPHFDRLAADGVKLTNAFTPSPVCSPARASLFTGTMPSQHGIHDWLKEDTHAFTHPGLRGQTLLPEILQRVGYRTGLVGKWHCGREREPQPGFDRWFSYWTSQYPHRGEQTFSNQGVRVVEQGQQSPLLTERALEFMREHQDDSSLRGRPFFLTVGYVDTHTPHADAPEDLVQKYRQATFADVPAEPFAGCHGRSVHPLPGDDLRREALMQYYAAVSSIDRELGRLLAELERTGQLDDTLVIYTSDHGLCAGHSGIWEKGNATRPQNFLDGSIRVGCTLRWPGGGIERGAAVDSFVNHCDLFVTLLDAAQARIDPNINTPGRSYLAELRGQHREPGASEIFCEYGNARMIRTERYKLIARYPFQGVRLGDELYDLAADPSERTNRLDDLELAQVVADLRGRLDRYFARYAVSARDGRFLESQPICTEASPWLDKINA